jgi:galactose mutarotase-like enzyme
MSATGRLHPYRFERTLSLRPGSPEVRFDYVLRNLGDAPLPFIWSAHPILAVAPGATIHVPASTRWNLFFDQPSGQVQVREGRLVAPLPTAATDGRITLGPLPGPEAGVAFKLWSDPGSAAWCDVADVGVEALRFDFAEVPNLGLWVNLGGWSGRAGLEREYYFIAVEPCIGAQDRLDDAVHLHRDHGVLGSGERRRWGLTVTPLDGNAAQGDR